MRAHRHVLPLMLLVFFAISSVSMAQDPATLAPANASGDSDPATLARIRRGLREEALNLRAAELPADFRLAISEQWRLNEMISKIDFGKPGPVPAGGLYAYEQQRRLFSPTERPLMQPYAAYSGAEFATIAIENLISHYLAAPALSAVMGLVHSQQKQAAKDEVAEAIAAYCAQRPDRDSIVICNRPLER